MPRATSRPVPVASRRRQRGVSLIIAMLMLVVIGFTSVAVMRNALSTDQVALNTRAQTQATQYAQAALRFCENARIAGNAAVKIQNEVSPANWTVFANWFTAPVMAYTLTNADLNGVATGYQPLAAGQMPQCIVEKQLLSGRTAWVTTTRGFSANYTPDAIGNTQSGSVIWLQSVVY